MATKTFLSTLICVILTSHFSTATGKASSTGRHSARSEVTNNADIPAVPASPKTITSRNNEARSKGTERDTVEKASIVSENWSEGDDATSLPSFPYLDDEMYYQYNVTNLTKSDNGKTSSGGWHVSDEVLDRLLCYAVRSFIVVVGILLAIFLLTLITNFIGRIKNLGP